MISLLRSVFELPAAIANRLTLRLRRVDWVEFPFIRGRLILGGTGLLKLGKGVTINSSHRSNPVGGASRTSIHIVPGATISIGDRVGISNSLLYAREKITIEEEVLIGGGCQIYDNDFHSIAYVDRIPGGDTKVKSAPVTIKRGAFIGTCTIILKGVIVGERSVIAAGSVVVKSVPADEIWGGNPAKFIRKLERNLI